MYNELLDVVDQNDQVIDTVPKYQVYEQKLINRIVHIIVVNSSWEIALQKRSMSVSYKPGAWSSSAGWHVSSWDDYETSANRELAEEIWVQWELTHIDKYLYTCPTTGQQKFLGIFEIEYEWEFRYEDGEVDYVEWYSLDDIKKLIEVWEDFHPEMVFILEKYYF